MYNEDPNTKMPKRIYEKFCNGDHLTDEQLELGAKHFGTMGTALTISGPVFALAATEALRVSDRMAQYQEARTRRAKDAA